MVGFRTIHFCKHVHIDKNVMWLNSGQFFNVMNFHFKCASPHLWSVAINRSYWWSLIESLVFTSF